MGNKSSSNKDPNFAGESRGRSRSFNGVTSRFRKTSRSPPRDRSNSISELIRPQRKGSGKAGQHGVLKSVQNGHAIRRGHDIPIATPTKSPPVIDIPKKSNKKDDSPVHLSQSAPGGKQFHYRYTSPLKQQTPVKDKHGLTKTSAPVENETELKPEFTSRKSSPSKSILILNEEDTLIKSSNLTLKNLKNNQLSNKSQLIENYAESPRLSVAAMRHVSRELFSDQLEDLAKRRGMATLNRDLSLSNASLGLLSNRSKSMHSLSSNDYDYEEKCNVGELLSFADSNKVGELCRSITSQFSSDNQDTEEMFLRPRTNSASAIDLGQRERTEVALGSTSAEIRKNLASQYAIDPRKSSLKSISAGNVTPDVIQARRMLVARALKDSENSEIPDDSSDTVTPEKRRSSPDIFRPDNRSHSPSALTARRSPSPASIRSSSPSLVGRAIPEKVLQQNRASPSSMLQNISEDQIMAANMTKSMQKFLLNNPGVGTNTTDYEKLHDKQNKKKKPFKGMAYEGCLRERSSSFSILSSKQKQLQFVQQIIQEQLNSKPIEQEKQVEVFHVQSKSYDETPVSTGGDSGFRSRSQSWSSLSRKSMYESQQLISDACALKNPVSSLWNYSEMSLSEWPLDLSSQPQRFISIIEDDGTVMENFTFSNGML